MFIIINVELFQVSKDLQLSYSTKLCFTS